MKNGKVGKGKPTSACEGPVFMDVKKSSGLTPVTEDNIFHVGFQMILFS